ncbi:MAG: DNA polymerase I [Bacteroidales bacterium]|jgi:DNA polymerase-1|nr:DNA polymerase I [Bacteroidales bacterium]
MADKKLFLLDAYALIYRAYYALIRNPMFSSSGFNTSTIFGFTNTLEEVLAKEKPTHIAVAFDPPTPTFRHEMYPQYKAQREETPEEIIKSVPRIKEIIEAYRIPIIQYDGYEADDVVGTIAKHAAGIGYKVYMMTPDKDYVQLVSDNILMYKPARSGVGAETLDTAKVCEKYGVKYPEQFIEVLALMGDKSDNVPGVKGIGEVGATRLIAEFDTVENLLANIDRVKGANRDKIIADRDSLVLSKKLVTICTDVPIRFSEEDYQLKTPDTTKLKELFKEFNFRTFLSRLEGRSSPVPSAGPQQLSLFDAAPSGNIVPAAERMYENICTVAHEYITADTPEKRRQLIDALQGLEEFCFDTETTGLETFGSELVGMSFAVKPHHGWYVPVPASQEETQAVVNEFKALFENPHIRKIGQNLKFDMLVLQQYGVDTAGTLFDTMLAHYLLQPEQRHNLNYLSEKYLDYSPVEIETLIGKSGRNQLTMRQAPPDKIAEYAAEDADVALQLQQRLEKDLETTGMSGLAQTVEMPLVKVLVGMEATGVKIDVPAMEAFGRTLNSDSDKLEEEIYELAGMRFNIASPKQLGDVLFLKLKISEGEKSTRKTKTKQFSTSEEVLTGLEGKHPVVSKILEYRGLKKLQNTYVEALPKLINPRTGRIHTSFNQAVTATGRLSSTDPNLQNIPIREDRGRELRKAFIPSDDRHLLLSSDYSQIELRLMAHMSGDPNMQEAFRHDADIHAATAAKIYGIPVAGVTSDMRRKAKTANFGIIYGISVFGLSQRLGIPRNEAQELISGYFDAYPEVRRYMNDSIDRARAQGYVETLMGRRRYLPDIRSANAVVRGMAERNAINAPLQGSAADIIKLAMIRIDEAFRTQNLQSKMILQVHDELVFDVLKPEMEQVKEIVRREMEGACSLAIPLTVEMGEGKNWLEAH